MESSGVLAKTVPEAPAPCGHRAHPGIAGGMFKCIQLQATRGWGWGARVVDSTKVEKKSHKESGRGAHSYIQPSISQGKVERERNSGNKFIFHP